MIRIITAMDAHRIIGKDGALPWHLPEDLRHFRRQTQGQTVLMGRKTFETLPAPLPGRRLVVLTSSRIEGVECVSSVEEARRKHPDMWIAGGARVYEAFLPLAAEMWITQVYTNVQGGDTRFPAFRPSEWRHELVKRQGIDALHKYPFSIFKLTRRK